MALSREKLFDLHSQNLAAVDRAIGRIRKTANRAVAVGDLTAAADLTNVYGLLLAAKMEARLRKLLYERSGFTADHRARVLTEGNQTGQWLKVIDEAVKLRYNASRLRRDTVPLTAWLRRDVLRAAVKDDLKGIIELRNKLAHGQWAVALNSAGTNRSPDLDAALRGLNLLGLKHQDRLVTRLGDVVTDLVVSRRTFERDFDKHFAAVEDARRRLAAESYGDWTIRQRKSYQDRPRKT